MKRNGRETFAWNGEIRETKEREEVREIKRESRKDKW